MKYSLLIFLLLLKLTTIAQDTKEQLAIQYFQNEEYNKALEAFEALYNSNPTSWYYYNYYLDCMLLTDQYAEAESFLKKLTKKYKSIPAYQIDLGYVYQMLENERKSKKIFDDLISDLIADEDYIQKAANAFIKRNEYQYAIKTYEKGRKILLNDKLFPITLANLYQKTGAREKMLQEYLNVLNQNPSRLESIQNLLQDYIFEDDNYDFMKEMLIREVQKSNYNSAVVDLLSWIFIQKKDFKAAFIQQKALDKRFKNNNQGLVRLAQVCISNEAYDVAEDIFEYITSKGYTTPYYYHARFGLLDISYLKVTNQISPSKEDLLKLEKDYSDFLINDFYKYIDISEKVILRLGEIRAIYLNKVPQAIKFLEKYLDAPQISKESIAQMKLNLGDYYVLLGDVWEATLLYKQVEKDFRDHPLGHMAKFRDAKLAFYRGQFEWAKDYLDILKASTSELIANDALQLSLLIQDNLEDADTSNEALKMYARADFFVFKNQLDSAVLVLDSFLNYFVFQNSLTDEVYILLGDVEYKRKNFEKALADYAYVYTNFSDDILADDALYKAANIYEKQLKDNGSAAGLYEKIILNYPESIFVVDARKKYRANKKLTKEDMFYQDTPVKP